MQSSRAAVDEWATAESQRIRDWQSGANGRIQKAMLELQGKLREAAASKARAIASILAQRASLRVSIEEHNARVEAADLVHRVSPIADRAKLLTLLKGKQIRPFTDDQLHRWGHFIGLEELNEVRFEPPPDAPGPKPSSKRKGHPAGDDQGEEDEAEPVEEEEDEANMGEDEEDEEDGDRVIGFTDPDEDAEEEEAPEPLALPPPISDVIETVRRKLCYSIEKLPVNGALAVLSQDPFRKPSSVPGTLHVGGLQGLSGDRFASYYPLIIWDARTRTVLHELTHSWDVYVRAVVELPGNRLFANITPGYNGPPPYECFRVYDLVSGKILQEFNETKDFFSSVMWADFAFADGHLIVSSRDRGINGCMTLHVWPEGPDGMFGASSKHVFSTYAQHFAPLPNSTLLAVAGGRGRGVLIYDWKAGKEQTEQISIRSDEANTDCLAVLSGNRIAFGCRNILCVAQINRGVPTVLFQRQWPATMRVVGIAVSDDGETYATYARTDGLSFSDKTPGCVQVWRNNECEVTFEMPQPHTGDMRRPIQITGDRIITLGFHSPILVLE